MTLDLFQLGYWRIIRVKVDILMLTNNQNEMNNSFKRIRRLVEKGVNPYPHHFPRTFPLYEVNEDYEDVNEEGVAVSLNLCGRVTLVQATAQGTLVQMEDRDAKLDCQFQSNCMSDENRLNDEIVIGDFIGVETDFLYRHPESGHLTAYVNNWCFLSLNLDLSLTLPKKHTFLYVSTDFNTREQLIQLSKIIRYVRRFLEANYDFFDFSTAVMSRVATEDDHEPTMPDKSFLQPSLFLKQLIVAGLERVYEIYDNGLYGQRDYPQSQILECCMALSNLNDMLNLTEKLLSGLTKYAHSTYMVSWISIDVVSMLFMDNKEKKILIDLTPPWPRRYFYQLIEETIGVDFLHLHTVKEAIDVAVKWGVNIPEDQDFAHVGQVAIEVFDQLIAPQLIQPTFVTGYPIEVYPTAKPNRSNSRMAEFAQLFINGFLFGTAMSDQTNPEELQSAMQGYTRTGLAADSYFVSALNYGVPPMGHLVIFLEPLSLLILGTTNMREVIPSLI